MVNKELFLFEKWIIVLIQEDGNVEATIPFRIMANNYNHPVHGSF